MMVKVFEMRSFFVGVLVAVAALLLTFGVAAKAEETPCKSIKEGAYLQEVTEQFREYYNSKFSPQEFSTQLALNKMEVFDCRYMLIFEFHPREHVFGVETAFVFSKNDFLLIWGTAFE